MTLQHDDQPTEVRPDQPAPPADVAPEDEEYLEQPGRRWSRLTTALVVWLVFLLGMLAGTLVSRLGPPPAPQVVYVLGDSSAAPTTAEPSSTPSR